MSKWCVVGDVNGAAMTAGRVMLTLLATLSCVLSVPALGRAQTVEYYTLDALGSVRVITDQAGAVMERHDYLPFGEEWNPPPSTDPRKFTGKERDAETGLDYFGARYYSGKRAQFTTVDPVYTWQENLADPQRWNRYAYVRNNPLRYTDPDGRAIDVIADIAFIAYDLFDIGRSLVRGEGVSGMQAGALGADVLGAAIPFATGGGAALRAAAKADVLANRVAGKLAEQKVAQELAEEGLQVVGSQVCCNTAQGRRVIDHLTKDASGTLTAVEVKSGKATRSAAQRAKDAEIAAGRGTFVGKNAPSEVRGTQRPVQTVERKPNER